MEIPDAASGAEAQQIQQNIVSTIQGIRPDGVGPFGQQCMGYGQCGPELTEAKAQEFYDFLMNTFGPEFTQSMLPQLVRLLPAKDKRECLLKKGGFLQPPAAAPQSLFADAPAAPAAPPAAPPASQSLFATTNDPFAAPTNAFAPPPAPASPFGAPAPPAAAPPAAPPAQPPAQPPAADPNGGLAAGMAGMSTGAPVAKVSDLCILCKNVSC
jgi:hypothetical protein